MAMGVIVAVSACSSSGDKAGGHSPVSVKELHVLASRSTDEMKTFVDRVADVSAGRLTLVVDGNWEVQNPAAELHAIGAVEAGRVDLAIVPARAWHDAGVTAFDALIAPFAIENLALQEKVMESDLSDTMLRAVEPRGLAGIGILPGPIRRLAGVTRSFTDPGDFKDARIGYYPSAVEEAMLRELGATPMRFIGDGAPLEDLDGIIMNVTGVPQYSKAVRNVTANVSLFPRPNVVVANANAHLRLSATEREWLRTAAREAIAPMTSALRNTDEAAGVLCHQAQFRFVFATPESIAAVRAKVHPVETWLRENSFTAGYLDRIAQLHADVAPFPYPGETPACLAHPDAGGPTSKTAARNAFDGTYRMDAPANCDPAPENCGTWSLVFDRGRFAFTQEDGIACTWGYGTLTVSGNEIAWSITDGGGYAPHGTVNRPGERFVYAWNLYKERMTLALLPVGPAFVSNSRSALIFLDPWRRLSATGERSYLSSRCPPPREALP
jgi:TRAP-type transport system periplasmic protein